MSYEIMRSAIRKSETITTDPCTSADRKVDLYVDHVYGAERLVLISGCYFGKISRATAEKYLKERGTCEGTYLIRIGNHGGYRLSVLCLDNVGECHVVHYEIITNSNGTYSIGLEKSFTTVTCLVNYYKGKHTEMEQHLTEPCPTKDIDQTDTFDLEQHSIKLKTQLFLGAFSDIWIGTIKTTEKDVIIKSLSYNNETYRNYLLREIQSLQNFHHKNVINLLGQCRTHPVCLVFEYYSLGNLSRFLLKNGTTLQGVSKLQLGQQILNGLNYLAGMNYVHRNIRASNIIMTNEMTCKLAGFGYAALLNHDGKYLEREEDKPFDINAVRWMAPEAATKKVFSIASDVWSFASTVHEIFSNGEVPYSDVSVPNISERIRTDHKPPRPKNFSFSLYRLLVNCWDLKAEKRPLFNEIQNMLTEITTPIHEEKKILDTVYETPDQDIFESKVANGSATTSTSPGKNKNKNSPKQQKNKLKNKVFNRREKR